MELREQILRDEGIKRYAYQDSEGYWTIGVGRMIDQRKGGGISYDEAMILLDNDIQHSRDALISRLDWFSSLDDARQGVLVNMHFNMGNTLFSFVKTLDDIEHGHYADAADEMLASKWTAQVGARAYRLAEQMRTGLWV